MPHISGIHFVLISQYYALYVIFQNPLDSPNKQPIQQPQRSLSHFGECMWIYTISLT